MILSTKCRDYFDEILFGLSKNSILRQIKSSTGVCFYLNRQK